MSGQAAGKRATALGLAEGVRVRVGWTVPGQPPLAMWVVESLDPDDIHMILRREEGSDYSMRVPLVAAYPYPRPPETE